MRKWDRESAFPESQNKNHKIPDGHTDVRNNRSKGKLRSHLPRCNLIECESSSLLLSKHDRATFLHSPFRPTQFAIFAKPSRIKKLHHSVNWEEEEEETRHKSDKTRLWHVAAMHFMHAQKRIGPRMSPRKKNLLMTMPRVTKKATKMTHQKQRPITSR